MPFIHFIQEGGLFTMLQAGFALLCIPALAFIAIFAHKLTRKALVLVSVALEFPVLALGIAGYINATRMFGFEDPTLTPGQNAALAREVTRLAYQQWYIPLALMALIWLTFFVSFSRTKK